MAKSVPSAANFLEVIILARVLGLEGFGTLTLVVSYVGIVNVLLDFRVWEATVRYVGEFLEKKESGHILSMIKFSYVIDVSTGLLAFFVSIALASLGNDLFIKSPDGFDLILIFSFSLLFSTANATSGAIFRVFDRFKTIIFVKLFDSALKLTLLLVVLYLGYGIKGVLVAYIIVSFSGFVLRQILVDRMLKHNKLGSWISSGIGLLSNRRKEIVWFLLNTSFNATLKTAGEGRIASLALGYFFGPVPTALYRVARSVKKTIGRISDPLYEALFPRLVSLSTANLYGRFVELVRFASGILLKLVIPVLVVILLFAEQIIGLIFGGQYVAASNTMRVLTVSALFTGSTFWLTPTLLAIGRPGLRTAINAFRTLTYIILLLALVPMYSYLGAAVAFLIAEFLNFVVAVYLVSRLKKEYSE